ncbi:MAG: recombinase RecT [Nitrospinae bacterium]|nr:recombinase RecT [Nitrospinota bacterium]
MNQEMVVKQESFMSPTTELGLESFINRLAWAKMLPRGMDAATAFGVVMYGLDIGFSAIQSLKSIALINGRPTVWGDSALGLARASGLMEYCKETRTMANGVMISATCEIKRKDDASPSIQTFTVEQAKKAGLYNKQGPWTTYPERMLQMRARSWAIRDAFPDLLQGISLTEEARDFTESAQHSVSRVLQSAQAEQDAKSFTMDEEVVDALKPTNHSSKEQSQEERMAALESAKVAAERGTESYKTFWQTSSTETKRLLLQKHEDLKLFAAEIDKTKAEQETQEPEIDETNDDEEVVDALKPTDHSSKEQSQEEHMAALESAKVAAERGTESYKTFWQTSSTETKRLLLQKHEDLKLFAAEIDKTKAEQETQEPEIDETNDDEEVIF